jgi:hypothetical protein
LTRSATGLIVSVEPLIDTSAELMSIIRSALLSDPRTM